jgi:two-component system, NtrC family, sensor histidine kinase HydH
MDVHGWVSLTSGVAHIALGTLVLLRGPRTPMRLPLGISSLVIATWNLASLAYDASGERAWYYVDNLLSPFSGALGVHIVVAFVGRARVARPLLVIAYAASAATSVIALSMSRTAQSVSLIGVAAISLVFSLALLFVHLRQSADDPVERYRTRILIASILISCVIGPTEMGIPHIPPVGNLGILVSTILVAVGVMRFQLLGRDVSPSATIYSLFISIAFVVAAIITFKWMGASSALIVIGSVLVTFGILVLTRAVLNAQQASQDRVQRLATMGRFSTQLAHDLRNPIAAIRGATQYLDGEPDGKTLGECRQFVRLVAEQADRMQRVVEEYQRIGRVEPEAREVDVNELVARVTHSQDLVRGDVEIATELASDLPRCSLDPELMTTALENILRNAFEAAPRGQVRVRTERTGASAVAIVVEDDGKGVDPREVERVFDDFFTTKSNGSGLGLSFVRRVMRAHGGEASLSRARSGGTVVRLRLPTSP